MILSGENVIPLEWKISFEKQDSKSQSSQNENFLMVAFLFTSTVMGKKKKGQGVR